MKEKSYDIPLHDIKPLLEVEEYSLYYFLGASFLALVFLFGIIYLIYIYFKNKNAYNIRKDYLKKIELLNLKDTKKSAYALTLYGEIFKDDSPRHIEMYKNITQRLEPYKYKKTVDEFDKETLAYIELYKEMLDV
ncbi:MAG: hypothetical protein U9P72_06255 [Campylobacterota bacterium]|nr:hypothetical protein [Campylobacterota bacterium]